MTYPSIIIDGPTSIGEAGSYNYTKTFSPNDFSAEITSVHWTTDCSSSVATIADTQEGNATFGVINVPATGVNATITCTVTFDGNITKTGRKSITIIPSIPTSITINGSSTISDTEDYNYTISYTPNWYTAQMTNF